MLPDDSRGGRAIKAEHTACPQFTALAWLIEDLAVPTERKYLMRCYRRYKAKYEYRREGMNAREMKDYETSVDQLIDTFMKKMVPTWENAEPEEQSTRAGD